jgi:hypothetical protein
MRIEQLRTLVRDQGPFVSVYVDASHDTEDAVTRNELRWRAMETDLWDAGADQATIEAVRRAVLDRPAVGTAGRAVIAAHGEVLLTEDLPLPPAVDMVRFSALPYLLPLLSSLVPPVPHVVVLADKTGARLRAVDANGVEAGAAPVQGRDHPVHHVAGGGPAHGSMENRSEETVRRNARDIAEHAVRLVEQVHAELLVEQVHAELLVLAGTVSARTAIHAELPEHVRRFEVELDVNAAHTDLDAAEVTDGVARLLAQRQAQRDESMLERLNVGRAHGTACEGLSRVAESLRAGAVDTVLVTDPSLADRTVWLGEDRSQIATRESELRDIGAEAVERRADEAVPAAALATSADLLVLTGAATATDGVAALLRY